MEIQAHDWIVIKKEDWIKGTEELKSSNPKIIGDRIIKGVT